MSDLATRSRHLAPSMPLLWLFSVVMLALHPISPRQTLALPEPSSGAPPGYHVVSLNGHRFTLPNGFTIELVAGPPLIERPVSGSFDDKGRLYVTDSSGDNSRAPDQAKTKPHRIRRLVDTNHDGTFDRSTLFVKNVALPQGALFLNGSLYVAAPPQIRKYTDIDEDGVADKDEVWFDGKTCGGCGNDLHGPWWGPEGRIYWTKGGFEKQEYTLTDGRKWSTRVSHVFRAKLDGTEIEPVITAGMDNPVGLTFAPNGEILVCGTFLQHPADGKRDGIIHAVYGGVYGKDIEALREHIWTSPKLMPIMTHLGPAAPCALIRYTSDAFGEGYVDNLFCAQFNLRKVSRHILVPEGATFRTIDHDFVVSDNRDFHPTDVIEAPDGSLLIIDTGGWYKLCCPTSQLEKTDVLGAIYRVRRTQAGVSDTSTTPPIKPVVGEAKVADQNKSDELHQTRQAVEIFGRNRTEDALPRILQLLTKSPDRFLEHSCIYAMIEIGDVDTLSYLLSVADLSSAAKPPKDRRVLPEQPVLLMQSANVRRAVLTALDQMPGGGKLDVSAVINELDAADPDLQETAWWIASRHPEWGRHLARYFQERMKNFDTLRSAQKEALAFRLASFQASPEVRRVIGAQLEKLTDASAICSLLRGLAKSGLKAFPAEWKKGIETALKSPDLSVVREAINVLRVSPLTAPDHAVLLKQVLDDRRKMQTPLPRDLEYALRATAPVGQLLSDQDARAVIADTHKDLDASLRSGAVELLVRSSLSSDALVTLAGELQRMSAIDFAKILPTFSANRSERVGQALLDALSDPALRRITRIEQIKPIFDKYPASIKVKAEKLYALLEDDRKEERAKLDQLLHSLPPGDPRRGQEVFNSAKAACILCHKIGYVGGSVGPDLRRIGAIRSEKDLLEAIVFPSASFVRSYEPLRVITLDGKTYNGTLRKDASDEIILAISADQEVRISRDNIEEISPSTVSVMPAGLDQQLTLQELADLVAFLRANVK